MGELFLAIQGLRAAYNGIQYCFEALNEGTVQVQKIKKAAEQAKQIVSDAKSIWATIKGLFGSKPAAPKPTPEAAAAPAAPAKQEYIRHIPTETDIVQQFLGHVGSFFKTHKFILTESERLLAAEFAKDEPDTDVILQLSAFKAETDGAYVKISGMMRGMHVPQQLGPLWDNFNAIYGQVQEAQRDRKERERIKRNQDAWLQRQTRDFLIDRAVAVVLALLGLAWMWGLLWCWNWLGMTQRGFA